MRRLAFAAGFGLGLMGAALAMAGRPQSVSDLLVRLNGSPNYLGQLPLNAGHPLDTSIVDAGFLDGGTGSLGVIPGDCLMFCGSAAFYVQNGVDAGNFNSAGAVKWAAGPPCYQTCLQNGETVCGLDSVSSTSTVQVFRMQ